VAAPRAGGCREFVAFEAREALPKNQGRHAGALIEGGLSAAVFARADVTRPPF
jgi:hypothetical protein